MNSLGLEHGTQEAVNVSGQLGMLQRTWRAGDKDGEESDLDVPVQ